MTQTNKELANLLRKLADEIEKGHTTSYDSLGPALSAVLYDRRKLIRPTPIPEPPKRPDPPTIYYENGSPRPFNFKRKVELADTKTSTYVSFPHNPIHLSKFAKMETLSRALWAGKSKVYSDCLKLFSRYGFIEKKGNGWQWKRDFTPLQRREFARQWYPVPRT